MLRDFLTENRDEIIARARTKVAARASPRATQEELKNGVPLFLNQIVEALGNSQAVRATTEAIGSSAAIHGGKLLEMGFTVAQVVYDYGDICQVVTELADSTDAPITAIEFHTLNRCLDEAIAQAVTEFMSLRERAIVHQGTERMSVIANEMRSQLSAAMLSFDLLRKGSLGIGGSTGTALGRGLSSLRSIVDRSFAEARLDSGAVQRERISLSELLDDVANDAAIDASIRRIGLTVAPVERGVYITGDRQLLGAAVSNLLQNALKFSRAEGRVSLRSSATDDRVTIEIHDECGGLAADEIEALLLFLRPLNQRKASRTDAGLGLAIARESVEAAGGTLAVRSVPGIGCVFAVDLQRALQARGVFVVN